MMRLRDDCIVFIYLNFYIFGCKVVSFFVKSLNKPLNPYILGKLINLNLESSYFKSFPLKESRQKSLQNVRIQAVCLGNWS